MLEYLSNYSRGRRMKALEDYMGGDIGGRRKLAGQTENRDTLRRLLIWELHNCATIAPKHPAEALPCGELGLEMALRVGEDDLVSWAHSETGNCLRLLGKDTAKVHLDLGISFARSPYQLADATRQRGLLGLKPHNQRSARAALDYMKRAFEISPTGDELINSDRGHPVILSSLAIVHLYLGTFERSHLKTGKNLCFEILDMACPRHAKRSRFTALKNLAAVSVNSDERPQSKLLSSFRALTKSREIPRSSLLGALVQWVLIYGEIMTDGYDRNRRRRLLTVRRHLLENGAKDHAAFLTLCIGAFDGMRGGRALRFLTSEEAQGILREGGQERLAASLSRMDDSAKKHQKTSQEIVELIGKSWALPATLEGPHYLRIVPPP